jgi:hypothetical protein
MQNKKKDELDKLIRHKNTINHCRKNNFKFYIKIDIKKAPTCFGANTIIRKHTIRVF